MGHVFEIRNDGAGRGHARRVLVVGDLVDLEAVALLGVGDAEVGPLDHVGYREERVVHLERLEDALADKLLPRLARLQLDQVAGRGVHHVVVEEGRPRRLLGLHVPQLVEELLARVGRLVPDRVVAGDARPVGEHVAQSHGRVQGVVVELDRRDGVADGLVPGELPLFNEETRGDGREELRVRRDLVERVRGEGELLAVVAVAVALREDELVADDDAHTDGGDVPVLQGPGHPGIEVLELGGRVALGGLGLNELDRGQYEDNRCDKQRFPKHFHGAFPSAERYNARASIRASMPGCQAGFFSWSCRR
jgi:hypothetical protein